MAEQRCLCTQDCVTGWMDRMWHEADGFIDRGTSEEQTGWVLEKTQLKWVYLLVCSRFIWLTASSGGFWKNRVQFLPNGPECWNVFYGAAGFPEDSAPRLWKHSTKPSSTGHLSTACRLQIKASH